MMSAVVTPPAKSPSETNLLDGASLSLFQKVLLSTDGTVTDLLALYTGEQIRVKKIDQTIREGIAPPALACAGPARLLSRRILLSGSRNYLYADSVFVFERFSTSIQQKLLHTDRPIGLLWREEKLETYREIVDTKIVPRPEIVSYFDLPSDALFVSRTYLIHQGGRPLGAITEEWPLAFFRGPVAG